MTPIQKFMTEQFGGLLALRPEARFLGGTVFIPGHGLTSRIDLETTGTCDQYTALKVTMISTAAGKVDSHLFRFDEYLTPKDAGVVSGLHAWRDGSLCRWYRTQPVSVDPIIEAISQYLYMFRVRVAW